MKNRTISDEQFSQMTLKDRISSIYFCQKVSTEDETVLLLGHMMRIMNKMMYMFDIDIEEILERVPREWDETLLKRCKKKCDSLPVQLDDNERKSRVVDIFIKEDIRREEEMGRCSV